MKRLARKWKQHKRIIFLTSALIVAYVIVVLALQIPQSLYYPVGLASLVCLCTWLAFKFRPKPERYINEWGYVVLIREKELEHRHIAMRLLGRNLAPNEIVHHINGKRTDNSLRNLCLMDREKHELFHSWLSWKKRKSGKYPEFSEQKRILTNEHGGILLETLAPVKPSPITEAFEKKEADFSRALFNELRKERKRLASEKNIPAYMIFNDKTLLEMTRTLPDTDDAISRIQGVGPVKLSLYGNDFLPIIKKFKRDQNNTNRKGSA